MIDMNYSYNLVGWDREDREEGLFVTLRVPLHVGDIIYLPSGRTVKVEAIVHELGIRTDCFDTKHYEDVCEPFVRVV